MAKAIANKIKFAYLVGLNPLPYLRNDGWETQFGNFNGNNYRVGSVALQSWTDKVDRFILVSFDSQVKNVVIVAGDDAWQFDDTQPFQVKRDFVCRDYLHF